MEITPDHLDEYTDVFYLEVPGSQVVLLQAYFEHYEGIGIVRTLSIKKSLVCILTTPSMVNDCIALLNAISDRILWRIVPRPEEAARQLYLGYFKNASQVD